jgi:hypothetical protein
MKRGICWTLLVIALGLPNCSTHESDAADAGDEITAGSALELFRGNPFRDACFEKRGARENLTRVALRLADLQADSVEDNAHNGASDLDPDDGGWDFDVEINQTSHLATASPENTYGATGLGIWAAVRAGAERPRLLTSLLDAALGIGRNPSVDSPPDFVYLVLLAELFENPELSALARRHYDARLAVEGGAEALATRVREARHAAGYDGLIAYDISWLMLGAAALESAFPGAGYSADADTYARVVSSDVTASAPYFDVRDARENFYVHGLSWTLVALSHLGSAPSAFQQVRSRLLAQQVASGGFRFNADFPDANLQATAHAVQALALSGRGRASSFAAIRRATRWLRSAQQRGGGWLSAATAENTLLDAEIALALFLSQTRGGEQQLLPDSDIGQVTAPLTLSGFVRSPPLARPIDL